MHLVDNCGEATCSMCGEHPTQAALPLVQQPKAWAAPREAWDGERFTFPIGGYRTKRGNWIRVGQVVFQRAYDKAPFGISSRIVSMTVVANAHTEDPLIWATVERVGKSYDRRIIMDLNELGLVEEDPLFQRRST